MVNEKNKSSNAKTVPGMVLFALSALGFLGLILTSPLLFINKAGYESNHTVFVAVWFAALVVVIACFWVSRRLTKGLRDHAPAETNIMELNAPWLMTDSDAVQYRLVQFDPQRGVVFKNDATGKDRVFAFDQIASIRHSYNLRLPVLYLSTKDQQKYTIAFVLNADDVRSIKKSIGTIVAFGEVGALASSSTALESSYRQIAPTGDAVERTYQWFKKNHRGIYKNKISRNILMLIIILAIFPAIMVTGIVIEKITK